MRFDLFALLKRQDVKDVLLIVSGSRFVKIAIHILDILQVIKYQLPLSLAGEFDFFYQIVSHIDGVYYLSLWGGQGDQGLLVFVEEAGLEGNIPLGGIAADGVDGVQADPGPGEGDKGSVNEFFVANAQAYPRRETAAGGVNEWYPASAGHVLVVNFPLDGEIRPAALVHGVAVVDGFCSGGPIALEVVLVEDGVGPGHPVDTPG